MKNSYPILILTRMTMLQRRSGACGRHGGCRMPANLRTDPVRVQGRAAGYSGGHLYPEIRHLYRPRAAGYSGGRQRPYSQCVQPVRSSLRDV